MADASTGRGWQAMTNAMIARVLGWTPPCEPSVFWRPSPHATPMSLPNFLGDDAVALRWCVPWLRERGLDVHVKFDRTDSDMPDNEPPMVHIRVYGIFDSVSRVRSSASTLAHALCQVVDTLGKAQGDG